MLRRFAALAAACVAHCAAASDIPDTRAAVAAASPAYASALLAVTVNGEERADLVEVLQWADDIAVPEAALDDWRVRKPDAPDLHVDGVAYYRLSAMRELGWSVDAKTQTLLITAAGSAFEQAGFSYKTAAPPLATAAAPGAFLNYDLQMDRSNEYRALGGLFELGVFNRWGTASSTSVYRDDGMRRRHLRLDSSMELALPQRNEILRIGDSIGQSGYWGRAVRFGGVQWRSNFAAHPEQVTFAMPALRGEAALPSTVDLYVNGSHRLQGNVQSGPFELPAVPLVTGQGEIRMAVRDLLGREQITTLPYYVSRAQLKPGLHEFSAEAGYLREDFGLESNRYGQAFVATNYRRGISANFTGEVRAELLKSQRTIGAAANLLAPSIGTLGMGAAVSSSAAGSGWMAAANAERQTAGISGSMRLAYYSRGFAQLGRLPDDPVRSEAAASIGMPWKGGGLGLAMVQQDTWQDERRRMLSATFSRALNKYGYFVAALTRQMSPERSTALNIAWVYALDQRTSASVNMDRARDSHLRTQWQRNAPAGEGFGYQFSADRGRMDGGSAQATWNTKSASLNAGIASVGGNTAYRFNAVGGAATLGNGVYFSRRIDDSFAVVSVGDYAGIDVLVENRPVARTDKSGTAFITGLRGYERSRIGIDQSQLPMDAGVERTEITIAPPQRSGAVIAFPVIRQRPAIVQLMTGKGEPVPAGAAVEALDASRRFTVGFEGKVFIDDIGKLPQSVLQWQGQTCKIPLAPHEGAEMDLGTVVCGGGAS